jgi:hypothetical protein
MAARAMSVAHERNNMSEQQPAHETALENLNDTNLALADAKLDIRGRKVIDKDGERSGT